VHIGQRKELTRMASFANLAAAEVRAKAKVADGTWIEAHSCATSAGAPAVRFIRRMTNAFSLGEGGWIETTDDSVT
jgi:hypothetical protein